MYILRLKFTVDVYTDEEINVSRNYFRLVFSLPLVKTLRKLRCDVRYHFCSISSPFSFINKLGTRHEWASFIWINHARERSPKMQIAHKLRRSVSMNLMSFKVVQVGMNNSHNKQLRFTVRFKTFHNMEQRANFKLQPSSHCQRVLRDQASH